jgi:hypothetical protein
MTTMSLNIHAEVKVHQPAYYRSTILYIVEKLVIINYPEKFHGSARVLEYLCMYMWCMPIMFYSDQIYFDHKIICLI